jgi:Thioesterase-like superfamily
MSDALYVAEGDVFVPTDYTTSPWSPEHCHGGPPAALLARAAQQLEPVDMDLSRITVEMLGPIPKVPVVVTAGVVRPGRKVQLTSAEMSTAEGEVLLRATSWRIRRREALSLPAVAAAGPPPPPPPSQLPPDPFGAHRYRHYYADAQERRVIHGAFATPGPAAMWFRLVVPLLAGEETTPEQRVVAAADSANGISSVASFDELLYINNDLTVYFARRPVGEWVAVDARSHLDREGRGLSDSVLYDEAGYLGRANQGLFVDER